MSIVLSTTVRNSAVNANVALLNAGRIFFLTAGNAVVAQAAFGPGATFAAASSGQSVLSGVLVDSFTDAGTITKFEIRDTSDNVLLSGTVTQTGGGGDIELVTTTFIAGGRLEVSNVVYTQPATEA